ncbi:MAG: zinc ribbon domain-containing protein [Ilumatobacteraceae bacterium]
MNGPALLALQRIDSEIEQIEARRKRLPERARLADATAAHTAHSDQRASLEATAQEAIATIERSEAAGAELDRKKARLEAQLKTIIAPREAEALMSQIATIDGQHSDLDDSELEAMEQQSQAESALAELAALEPPLLDALAAARADLDAALATLAEEEASARARRIEAESALDESDRQLYASAVSHHRGVGFATLERHTCTACHVDLSQAEYEQVIAAPKTDLPECPHCARYLVV